MEELQRIGHHVRDLRSSQMALARALVEISLNLPPQFLVNFLAAIRVRGGQFFHLPGPTVLQVQQNLLGQRIRESKGDKVGCAFTFDVWQVAARVNAAAKRIAGFAPHAVGAELMANTI